MLTRKNILLVYPEVPNNTYWSFNYALKFIHKRSSMPPLGLITVAALLPAHYQLKLIDMNVEPLTESDLLWADMVMISAMIVQKESMENVIAQSKRLNKTVIAGGPYPTSSYSKISGVDHFILGEVDDILPEVMQKIEKGNGKPIYFNEKRPNLKGEIIPRFDLLDIDAYASMSIQYSRGCPFKCEFCDIWKNYGNTPRLKRAANLIAELDELYAIGWRGPIFIVDDNFIGNKHRVKKDLLPTLIKWQKNHQHVYRFFTEASINLADDIELLSGMRDAGFNEVFVGIETPSQSALKETGKKQNLKTDLLSAIRKIQQFGIEVMAGFILGFDSDTEEIFDRQIDFIQQSGIPQAMVGLLSALPGTLLHQRLCKENRIIQMAQGNNTHMLATNFIPRMGMATLRKGYQHVLETVYDKNLKNYFMRCNQLLNSLGESPYFQRKIGFSEIRMLLMSLTMQPFTQYGFQYLKFILRNLLLHTKYFGEAIRYSIIGHHFHLITQETIKTVRVTADLENHLKLFQEQLRKLPLAHIQNPRDTALQLVELWRQKQLVLKKIAQKIDKIDESFQADIGEKYAEITLLMKMQLNTYIEAFKKAYPSIKMTDVNLKTQQI